MTTIDHIGSAFLRRILRRMKQLGINQTELAKRMQDAREVAPITDHLPTFNGWGKADKDIIDYIFIKGWSKCISYETVRKPYMDRKFISDHYPIKAVLEF